MENLKELDLRELDNINGGSVFQEAGEIIGKGLAYVAYGAYCFNSIDHGRRP